jgi:hypothetical protein
MYTRGKENTGLLTQVGMHVSCGISLLGVGYQLCTSEMLVTLPTRRNGVTSQNTTVDNIITRSSTE